MSLLSGLNALAPARNLRSAATLSRAWNLLQQFHYEQTDPARFYSFLAKDTVAMVKACVADSSHNDQVDHALNGLVVVDVGGGPGFFADAYTKAGARYVSVEPDVGEMSSAGIDVQCSIRGSGMQLPIASNSVDVCVSSNVAEHVKAPWEMAEEMVRITRPGGVVILSYTIWLGPFGGHEMGRTHYLGGHRARHMYQRKHGKAPKNYYGTSLFDVGCADGLRWAFNTPHATCIAAFPRYNPSWSWWVLKVPLVREFIASNLVVVMQPHQHSIYEQTSPTA